MKIYTSSKEHIEAKNRQRRVIIRLDALGEHLMHMRNLSKEDYFSYLFGFLDKGGHQVDCIFWDIMYGADFAPMYDSKILPARNRFVDKLGKGVDFIGEILKESKRRIIWTC